MPRSLWSGSISFGLLNIPIKLYPAIDRGAEIHFRLLHVKDKAPLQQKLFCPVDKKEVARGDAVRGYELSKNEFVIIEEEEIESLLPKASRAIELLDFVSLESIDPIYFHQPYYAIPDERAAKAYSVFLEALKESSKAGIGTFVMRNKQYLAVLRPLDTVICLETMYFKDDVISTRTLEGLIKKTDVTAKELKIARQLIDTLSRKFKPEKYHDNYREAVLGLIKKKSKGKKIVTAPVIPTKTGKVIDLMSALQASLNEAKRRKKPHAA